MDSSIYNYAEGWQINWTLRLPTHRTKPPKLLAPFSAPQLYTAPPSHAPFEYALPSTGFAEKVKRHKIRGK